MIVLKLLTTWGYDGFQAHTLSVSEFYREKRDVFDRLLRKHMIPQEGGACGALVEWSRPESGMFFW
jgi:tryptophan aminotransferase